MAGTGLLFSYIVGAFMRYNQCVWVYMALPVMFLVGSTFLHETPFHLIANNKLKVRKEKFELEQLSIALSFVLLPLNDRKQKPRFCSTVGYKN